jgi:hypothetical protein
MRRMSLALGALACALPVIASTPVAVSATAQQSARSAPDAVLAWNVTAVNAALASGNFQVESLIRLAYVQAAVYDAVVAIDGGYQPYVGNLRGPRGASVDAATAAAAHRMLVVRYPAQRPALDANYATALAAMPAGWARSAGVGVGERAAADVLAARRGDGLDANVTYSFGSGPGAWILPTDNTAPNFQTPQTPWVGQMRPFLIEKASQFRPAPPPALSSRQWATEFNEVKAFGARTSLVRTPEETQVATFWSAYAPSLYSATIRTLAVRQGLDAAQTARALAMTIMVISDSGIACFNAKYHYSFWRPYTAIRAADTDGNPATTVDPDWLPLLPTPNHPEYPGAHGCGTSAFGHVIAAVLGTPKIGIDVFSPATNTTRHFATVGQLTTEIVNARVWAGIHYRGSAKAGVDLGTDVARAALRNHFGPTG